ncbi:hypothetical protein JCM10908_004220 [Rhodotorula pacifica]|uniref:uncharacterized protein n=1 Tax=Rhodotorula pacifica TaxID=1495444 RepID=UPI00317F9124
MPLVGSRYTKSRQSRTPSKRTAKAYAPRDGWSRIEEAYQGLAGAFERLGGWISTHQTLSLLATALVICSLLSPAILITFSPSGSFLDVSTSAITRRGRGEFVWELEGMARQGLISTEEEVCWDRVRNYYAKTGREGGGTRIRVEQILVPVGAVGTSATSRATITKAGLHRIWRVQEELERRLQSGEIAGNVCIRKGSSAQAGCAVLSPTEWWTDEAALLRDEDVHRTLSSQPPSQSGITLPLTLSDTFVGIGRDRNGVIKTAQQIILTFLLESPTTSRTLAIDSGAQDSDEEFLRSAAAAWRTAVHDVVGHRGWHASLPSSPTRDPIGIASDSKVPVRHVVLKYLPRLTVEAHPRLLENTIYGAGYALVLVYVSRFVRKLRAHSKLGLLATGAVELVASGIMSVSICWILGWGLSLVPWNLLAFLVLTSGLDNMILVLRAISNTDVNLPVPRRMSMGLRTVGAEMTMLLVVEELLALGLLWWVDITVMREWIRFGAVVLVVDYFLELTFFSTVLSIDIQRLELADLLAQNNAAPYKPLPVDSEGADDRRRVARDCSSASIARSVWKVLRDRPAKTSTVAFLWVINAFLLTHYGSEHYLPAACSQTALSSDRPFLAPALSPSVSRSLRIGQGADSASSSHSEVMPGAAETFWHVVNPNNSTSLQVYLEPPVSIQFLDDGALTAPESLEALLPHEHATSIFVKVCVVLLPIAVVMGLLYVLLIYLLKDAELLQAHWGSEERLGGTNRTRRRQSWLKTPQAEMEAVPDRNGALRHETDVELIASAGETIVTWAALDTRLRVSRLVDGAVQHAYDIELAANGSAPALARIVLDASTTYCAVLDVNGRIAVWRLSAEEAKRLQNHDNEAESPAKSLTRAESSTSSTYQVSVSRPSTDGKDPSVRPQHDGVFVSLHMDGSVFQWTATTDSLDRKQVCTPAARRWLLPTRSGSPLSVGVDQGTGVLQITRLNDATSASNLDVRLGGERFTAMATTQAAAPGLESGAIVAFGQSSGVVDVYSLGGREGSARVHAFEEPIRKIALRSQKTPSTCSSCGSALGRECLVVASTRSALKVFRVYPVPEEATGACVCQPEASLRSAPGSPSTSRVSSMGTPVRTFSPRKKLATPTRPTQPLFVAESSLRPPMPPSRTSSSSGSSSPERERNATASPAAPPPRSKPVSPHASPSAKHASLPETTPVHEGAPAPLDSSRADAASKGSATFTPVGEQMQYVELASVAIDERGSWVALEDRLIGLRRTTESPRDGDGVYTVARGWEVWSLTLGSIDGSLDAGGFLETASPLEDVLGHSHSDDAALASHDEALRVTEATSALLPNGHSASALRRRRPSILPLETQKPAQTPSTTLPFSRARPMVSALDGTAVAVGLGNQVAVLRPTLHGQAPAIREQRNGFLGI